MKNWQYLIIGFPAFSVDAFSQVSHGTRSYSSSHALWANDSDGKDESKIGFSGLLQLITAGMGSPFLGDFEGVDEETGNFMFSLEANNLVDENGESRQTKAAYFESGWVSEEDLEKEKQKKEKKGGGFKFPWDK